MRVEFPFALTEAFLLKPTEDTCLLGLINFVNSNDVSPPDSAVPATIWNITILT